MAYTRSLSKLIAPLSLPSMGQPFASASGSPSSFNDTVGLIQATEHAGWTSITGVGSNVGGIIRPLCGDHGANFVHSDQALDIVFALPAQLSRYSLSVYCKSIAADHTINVRFERDVNGVLVSQTLMALQSTTQLGAGPKPHLFTGLIAAAVTSNIHSARLWIEVDKGSQTGNNASSTYNYWDGVLSFALKFFAA